MSALPVIAKTFRVALNWLATGGQVAANVMHFLDVAGGHSSNQLMAALDSHVTANMWQCIVPSAVVVDVAITPLDGVTATTHYNPATPANWTGQNGTDWIPAGAAVLKLTTGLRGRSKRGRLFLPFLAETQQQNGLLVGSTPSDMSTHWQNFDIAMAGNSPAWQLGVASYKLAEFNACDSPFCETAIGCQRRRQERVRGA
jgi:hypothetical protein